MAAFIGALCFPLLLATDMWFGLWFYNPIITVILLSLSFVVGSNLVHGKGQHTSGWKGRLMRAILLPYSATMLFLIGWVLIGFIVLPSQDGGVMMKTTTLGSASLEGARSALRLFWVLIPFGLLAGLVLEKFSQQHRT